MYPLGVVVCVHGEYSGTSSLLTLSASSLKVSMVGHTHLLQTTSSICSLDVALLPIIHFLFLKPTEETAVVPPPLQHIREKNQLGNNSGFPLTADWCPKKKPPRREKLNTWRSCCGGPLHTKRRRPSETRKHNFGVSLYLVVCFVLHGGTPFVCVRPFECLWVGALPCCLQQQQQQYYTLFPPRSLSP